MTPFQIDQLAQKLPLSHYVSPLPYWRVDYLIFCGEDKASACRACETMGSAWRLSQLCSVDVIPFEQDWYARITLNVMPEMNAFVFRPIFYALADLVGGVYHGLSHIGQPEVTVRQQDAWDRLECLRRTVPKVMA